MFVLPVSGTPVSFRAPNGHDDMLFAENVGGEAGLRVDVVRRLARPARTGCEWNSLPYVDVDAALLGLRQFLAGDRLIAEIRCGCGAWGDVELSIADYLNANQPRTAATMTSARIPTVDRVLAAVNEHGPGAAACAALEAEYLKDCGPQESRRALALLEKVAPPLAGPIEGTCPHCGGGISGWFDPGAFVIAELRARAAIIFEEVHLLASRYGWSEERILAMPGPRRAAYAELIAAGGRTP